MKIRKSSGVQKSILMVLSFMLIFSNFVGIGAPMMVSAAETGDTVYVSSDGDDSNDGSENSPYATIKKAYEEITDEGIIALLSDVTLKEQLTLGDEKEVTITSKDEADKKSIIRGESYQALLIEAQNKVTFKNLIIDGDKVAATASTVRANGANADVLFESVEVINHELTANEGSIFLAFENGKLTIGDGTLIKDNTITGTKIDNPPSVLGAGNGGHIFITGGEITDNTVTEDSNGVIAGIGKNKSPSFTMTGGAIKNNQLNGSGEVNDATKGNTAVYMRGTASEAAFNFGGTAYVFNNKDENGQQRNVFLNNTSATGSAYLYLIEAMKEDAKIGVFSNIMPTASALIVDVAIGKDTYTATVNDAAYFVSDIDTAATIQFDETDNKVILKPAEQSPGGVSEGLTSWVDVGRSANEDLTKLIDLVDGEWIKKSNPGTLGTLNFNDAISVNGSNNFFTRSKFDIDDTAREVFSVQAKSAAGFPWELGGRTAEGPNVSRALYTTNDVKVNFGMEDNIVTIDSPPNLTDGSLLNVWSAESAWELSINGETKKTETGIENGFDSVPGNDQYYIGAGHHSVFKGLIPETIMFDRKLDNEERQKVSSYLAIKYGLTLDDDYLDSDGATIWKEDNTYKNRITGIGRDNSSSLNQKQSKSEVDGANVAIALGNSIADKNADNSNHIANDKSFFMFGDDGEEGLERIYKVNKTNFADTNITIAVDEISGEYPKQLVVSSDDEFDNYKGTYYLTNGKVTINSADFADGDYFTFEIEEVNPGGVNGASLWLQPNGSMVEHTNGKVSMWKDLTSKENHASQNSVANQPTFKDDPVTNVNFNAMMNFDGNDYLDLDVNKLPLEMSERSIVAIAATQETSGYHYVMSWGAAANNQMMGMLQSDTSGMLTGYGNDTTNFKSSDGFWQVGVPNELFGTYDGTEGALYSRMAQIGKANRAWNTGVSAGARIGSLPQTVDQTWNGTMGDIIVFDKVLDETERQQLSSYLSIKYGYTLENVNYLTSDKSVVWDAATNSNYTNNIAGIARDDNGVLLQKQSNSTNEGRQVAIGIGALAATNSANTGTLTNGQYLIWGDNGEELTFTKSIENTTDKYHAERVWKAQNTEEVGEVQIAIPADAVSESATLLVSDSDEFAIEDEKELEEITLNGAAYYAAKVTLEDGEYFTFAVESPELVEENGVTIDGKTITLTFDEAIEFDGDANEGFTVTIGDEEITLDNNAVKVDPNDASKVIITLPTDTDVSDEVTVAYDEEEGNLASATTGAPVGEFNEKAIDPFADAFTIDEPSEEPVITATPEIAGKVEPGADVSVVIKDKDGNEIAVDGEVTVDEDGKWTFTPETDLVDGDYTIEATATKDGRTATKTKDMTIDTKLPELEVTAPEGDVFVSKPEFTGTATPGSEVTVKISDDVTLTTTANEDGNWSVTPDEALADGDYEVEITAEKDGKTSEPVTREFSIDTNEYVAYPTENEVTDVPEGITYDEVTGEFIISANFDEDTFTFKDGDKGMTATKDTDGKWVFTEDVDKSALENKRDEIEGEDLDESAYTPESWSDLTDALDNAKTVLNNPDATQEEVDEALASLDEARNNLTEQPEAPAVDKSALENKRDEIAGEDLDESAYTPESWSDLADALDDANKILNDPDARQEEVDDALEALDEARSNLTKKQSTPPSVEVDEDEYDETPTFTGKSNATEVTIELKDEAGNVVETVTVPVNEDGTWSFTPTNALLNGYYTLAVSATIDGETVTEEIGVTIEAKPTAEVTKPTENTVTTGKPEIAGTATPDATVTVKINDEITLTTKADADGNWSVTPKGDLPEGTNTIVVTAEKDGKTSDPVQKTITVEIETEEPTEPEVDKSLLENYYKSVRDLDKEAYTPETWADFATALNNAKTTLDNPKTTQDDVDNALDNLIKKHQKLTEVEPIEETDKTALQNMHDLLVGKGLNKDDYTSDSWEQYTTALNNAKKVLDNPDAIQDEVDQALTNLVNGYNGLEEQEEPAPVVVDKSKLIERNDEIRNENLDSDDYTTDSWKALDTALNNADKVLNNTDATQKEVDKALAALNKAYEALVEKPVALTVDKTKLAALNKEITKQDLSKDAYTSTSWKAFSDAQKHALAVLANENARQAEVDAALTALDEAYKGLTEKKAEAPKVDKSKLENLNKDITKQDLSKDAYTSTSWKTFSDAQKQAEKVLINPNATQKEVDEALKVLNKAYEGLAKKQVAKPTEKPEPTPEKPGKPIVTPTSPSTDDQQPEVTGEKLPGTATPIYNQLAFGLLVLLTGLLFAFVYRRKTNN